MRLKIIFILSFYISLLFPSLCFPQHKEEQEEKTLREQIIQRQKSTYKLNMQTGMFFGYDSNVRLDGEKNGDLFQEFLLSLQFKKPFSEEIDFNLKYVLDFLNYSDITSATNLLNKIVLELNKDISFFSVGSGYDLDYINYPHYQEGDFLFHKGFFYIGADLTKNLYHQLKYYYGIKDYWDAKALGYTIGSVQDTERLDKRHHLEYSLKFHPKEDLTLRLGAGYSINDSNAQYRDYYDYESPGVSCGLDFKLKPDVYFLFDYSYRRKNYKSRTVTSKDYYQEDNLHYVNLGFIYFLKKNTSISLKYTFRENSSNDSLSEYTENVITCGWQYYF